MTQLRLDKGLSLEGDDKEIKVVLRSDPVHGLEVNRAGQGKVNTEEHVIIGAVTVQQGVTKDERFEIDRKFLDAIVKQGNELDRGIRVRFDHPNASARSLGTYMGRASNFRRRGERVLADIALSEVSAASPDGDLLNYIEQMAVNEPDSFAMSIVFTTKGLVYRKTEDGELETDEDGKTLPPIPRLRKLWAVDFVDEGAATDALLGSGTPADVMTGFLDRYFRSRGFLEEEGLNMGKAKTKVKPDASDETPDEDATLEPEETAVALSTAADTGQETVTEAATETVVRKRETALDPEKLQSDAADVERQRVLDIQALGQRLGCQSMADQLVKDGTPLDNAARLMVSEHSNQNPPLSQHLTGAGRIDVEKDENDKFKEQLTLVLCRKAGVGDPPTPEQLKDIGPIAHWNCMAIAQLCCERAGMKVQHLDKMALAAVAMDRSGMALNHFRVGTMGTSTSDLPYLLENVINKSLMIAYGQAATTWQQWTKRGSVPDFKEFSRVRVSESDELELVLEGGEFQDSSLIDKAEKGKAATYGRIFSVTRQALVNDDLGEIVRQPTRFGFAAARLVDNLLYADLLQDEFGPMMMDPNPDNPGAGSENKLFVSEALATSDSWPDGRANYATGTDTAMDMDNGQAALNKANLLMRKRKGMKYEQRLNIIPWKALVPPESEMYARIHLRSVSNVTDAKNAGVINPWVGYVEPVVVPHLSDPDTTRFPAALTKGWYLVANPAQVDTYEVFFLDGFAQPTMEQEMGFTIDGMKYKVRMDVGVKCIDTVGIVKMKGDV